MCDDSCAIIPPLLREHLYEALIKMLSFSWKPALEMHQYLEIQNFCIFKSMQLEVKLLKFY